jgi:hypothetical protein
MTRQATNLRNIVKPFHDDVWVRVWRDGEVSVGRKHNRPMSDDALKAVFSAGYELSSVSHNTAYLRQTA